jgi:hypothetical protein
MSGKQETQQARTKRVSIVVDTVQAFESGPLCAVLDMAISLLERSGSVSSTSLVSLQKKELENTLISAIDPGQTSGALPSQ